MSIRIRIAGDPRQIDHFAARLAEEGLDARMAGRSADTKSIEQGAQIAAFNVGEKVIDTALGHPIERTARKIVDRLEAEIQELYPNVQIRIDDDADGEPPNTITIAAVEYRLVHTGGYAIHIAPDAASSTLCGRLIHYDDNEAVAPDCKPCLKKVTRVLATTEANARIELIVKLAVDIVVEFGSAWIVYVPADQADHLRAGVRAALRRRSVTGQTAYINDTVHVSSDQASAQIPQHIRDQRTNDILERLDHPDSARRSRSAQEIDWRTWAL